MHKNLIFAASLLVAQASFAQISVSGRPTTQVVQAKPATSTKPMKVGSGRTVLSAGAPTQSKWQRYNLNLSLHKQFMNFTLEARNRGKIEIGDTMDQQLGIGIGANNYSEGSAGVAARLIYNKYNSQSEGHLLEANVGYGMNQYVFPQAGLNLHRFAAGDAEGLGVGVSYQLGVAFRSNQNFGGQIIFRNLKNSGTIDSTSVDTEAQGLELSGNYYF